MPMEGSIAAKPAGVGYTDEAREEKSAPLITADGAFPYGSSPNKALHQETQLSSDNLHVSLNHSRQTGMEDAIPKPQVSVQDHTTQDLGETACQHEL